MFRICAVVASLDSLLHVHGEKLELTLHDPARHGHQVKILFYYPSEVPKTPVPLVVMAHCIFGGGSWYDYIGNALADNGYAMASIQTHQYRPVSSNSMAPDQAFVLDELRRQGREVPNFPLYGKFAGGKAAAMGHSLGGGASFYAVNKYSHPLQGRYTAAFDTILTMSACCGWDDSSIDVGACEGKAAPHEVLGLTRIPSLQLTGTKDCLCPAERVAEPFYRELASDCKYLVDITGATHCHFDAIPGVVGPVADKACVLVEDGVCALSPKHSDKRISLANQEQIVTEYALAWFDWTLRGNNHSLATFDARVREDVMAGVATLKVSNQGCPAPRDIEV